MNKAEQMLEKHINENDLNFIFHEKKDLWQELLNAMNEALGLALVVGRSEQLSCPNCKGKNIEIRHREQSFRCIDCKEGWAN